MSTFFIFIFGLTIGSFLNVVVYRLPIMLEKKWHLSCAIFLKLPRENTQQNIFNLFLPASHCPACKTPLKIIHNIPLLSFILQKSCCAFCQKKISIRYPFVELMSAAVFVWLFWQFSLTSHFVFAAIFSFSLIVLTFIDFDHQILPDEMTLPLMWLGLLVNLSATFVPITSAIVGAVTAYLILWSINFIFKQLTKKEGMGYGDFKLAAALGAWCGVSLLLFIFLVASLLGLLVALVSIILQKQSRTTPIPFGPYLCTAGFIALFWGYWFKQHWPGLFI